MYTPHHFSIKHLRLIILVFVSFTSMLLAPSASAGDVRCWTKSACEKIRADRGATSQDAKNGFYTGPDAKAVCGATIRMGAKEQPAGFCLPAGQTVTQISFGGKTTFLHIGEFIQFMYKYGFQIAIVLAIFVVLFAGFIWVQSRGNAEGIKSAQDKIYKAIMGLILYAISYTILNLVSPSFVNLRLPQVWMINPIYLTSQFCDQVDAAAPLAKLAGNDEARLMTNAEKAKKYAEIETGTSGSGFPVTPERADCGNTYLLARGNGTTCEGLACPGDMKTCYQRIGDPLETCNMSNVAGRIYNSNIDANAGSDLFGSWTWKWANEPEVYYVCADGDYPLISLGSANDPDWDHQDEEKKIQQYTVFGIQSADVDSAKKACGGEDKLKGFVLSLDINENLENTADERHFIGIIRQNHLGIDLGDKNNWDAKCLLRKAPPELFIKPEELIKGIRIDVDINLIEDIDEEIDRIKAYSQFDYKSCL